MDSPRKFLSDLEAKGNPEESSRNPDARHLLHQRMEYLCRFFLRKHRCLLKTCARLYRGLFPWVPIKLPLGVLQEPNRVAVIRQGGANAMYEAQIKDRYPSDFHETPAKRFDLNPASASTMSVPTLIPGCREPGFRTTGRGPNPLGTRGLTKFPWGIMNIGCAEVIICMSFNLSMQRWWSSFKP